MWDLKANDDITGDDSYGSQHYILPKDFEKGCSNEETDIYALGAVLREILYGMSHSDPTADDTNEEVINRSLKQADPKSADTYADITTLCSSTHELPKAREVLTALEKALEFQVNFNTLRHSYLVLDMIN